MPSVWDFIPEVEQPRIREQLARVAQQMEKLQQYPAPPYNLFDPGSEEFQAYVKVHPESADLIGLETAKLIDLSRPIVVDLIRFVLPALIVELRPGLPLLPQTWKEVVYDSFETVPDDDKEEFTELLVDDGFTAILRALLLQ